MDEMPRTTLTQRRSQISGNAAKGAEKLNKDMMDHSKPSPQPTGYVSPTSSTMPTGGMPGGTGTGMGGTVINGSGKMGLTTDRKAIFRIVAWILVVVLIGVGSALLVTNYLKEDKDDPVVTPVSNPVSTSITDDEIVDDASDDAAIDEEVVEDEEDTTVEEDTTPDPVTTGDITEFNTTDRQRVSATDQNNIVLNNFKFYLENGVFYYKFYNVNTTSGNIDPAASLTYDDSGNLTLELSNLYKDNVTGTNNTTSRTINGVSGLTGTETNNKGNVSQYKFLLTKDLKSRLLVDEATREITVEIKIS